MDNYTSQWKKTDQLQQKGLTESALTEVQKIYLAAKKAGNEPQLIKSLLYKINLGENIQEDTSEKSIDSLEREIAGTKGSARAILQSIAAQLYENYFSQNRYQLYGRTRTVNFDKKDIATWTTEDLHEKIAELYQASLKEKDLLQKVTLDPFDAIILKGNVRQLRPTLFDLLAHRALDYFKNDERDIKRPAYAFEIRDSAAFAPAIEFIGEKFNTSDTGSLHHQALLLFQQLLAFHLRDSIPEAFIDVDRERIQFVFQYGVMENKEALYIHSLRQLIKKYPTRPVTSEAAFLVAQETYNQAIEADRKKDSTSPYSVKNAKALLDKILKDFPASRGSVDAHNLNLQITSPELQLTTEKVNVPGEPFRSLITYRNTSRVFLRMAVLTPELKKYLDSKESDNQTIFKRLASERSTRSWTQMLPSMNDYLTHSVEVKIDGLPVGEYVLLGSLDENFGVNDNVMAAQYLYVSNISFINSGAEYFVLNRTTGKPIPYASVQLWGRKYNYTSRQYETVKQEKVLTDANGYVGLPGNLKKEDTRNIRLDISYKGDHLFLEDYQYVYYNSSTPESDTLSNQESFDKKNAKIFLFTDRSIYRPGQTVYFKGIGITRDYHTKKSILLHSKDSLRIIFYDANGQKIDSVDKALNEFGSLHGQFTIPENKLNGEFSIRAERFSNSSTAFSVEEYKRPRFYTDFEKVNESYRIRDTVRVTGYAKAYAGNDIDGATVTYRVTRVARFLYPWRLSKIGFPRSSSQEITSGEIQTGTDGKFQIQFAAIPDPSLDPATSPVFDYKVEADVTDINGETRSGQTVIPVGYQSLDLQIGLPGGTIVNKDSLSRLKISSNNLSGVFQQVEAEVKIFQLQPPDRLLRDRMWTAPDQYVLTKEEFIRYFPHDPYQEENQKENWPRTRMVYDKKDSTQASGAWEIDKSPLTRGWFVAEVSAKDPYGKEVKNLEYFQVYDSSPELPAPSYLWSLPEKEPYKTGQTATIVTGSSAKEVFLIQQIDTMETGTGNPISRVTPGKFRFISLDHQKNISRIPITEGDRGGFGVSEFFVKDNRFYIVSHTVAVPWTNKQLTISFDTYRDKMLPGSEEKWTLHVKGNQSDQIAAEMLAVMYDASLDQFRDHQWAIPGIWPQYNGYTSWNGRFNFTPISSFGYIPPLKTVEGKDKIYDALNYLPVPARVRVYKTMMASGMASQTTDMEMKRTSPLPVSDSMIAEESLGMTIPAIPPPSIEPSGIQVRSNFNETAFFFPGLTTDKDGEVSFSFTMPEALTRWKLMTLAHTKDLSFGYAQKTAITQKELMVQPHAPRFLRQGDQVVFSTKIVNMGEEATSGQAQLQLLDASTMEPVDAAFNNNGPVKNFNAGPGQSVAVSFNITIPREYANAVVYRIIAKAGDKSDGEEDAIPVVTNRTLVTESVPLSLQGEGSKDFRLDKLIQSAGSTTLSNYALTVEYSTNPAWYVVQALPYLIEFPYECAEQTFNGYYANQVARTIVNSSPALKAVFEKWKNGDSPALLSNLEKNEELKSVLLEETPWVLQGQNESQQKKNIGLLFDDAKAAAHSESRLTQLMAMQSAGGGFPWFKGGPDNRYITQYIVTGIGHLLKIKAAPSKELKSLLDKAIPYLDKLLGEDYDQLVKSKSPLTNNHLSEVIIQYSYMRSFFPGYPLAASSQKAFQYYMQQEKKYWLKNNPYLQGMIALSLSRTGDNTTAKSILMSLQQNSINDPERGRYWKEASRRGFGWYQAPVESQALLIEAFDEIGTDRVITDELRRWLLTHKQTNDWGTTKATAEACYALLLHGSDWLSQPRTVSVQLGDTLLDSRKQQQEAGTGYFKGRISARGIKADMGKIRVTVSAEKGANQDSSAHESSWGAVYWQYFEDLDKISYSATPLQLSRKLFLEKNSDKGPVLIPVEQGDTLQVGDKIKVRIELRADREMDYVHMKDMRASCMEPVGVISGYHYQGGLGYYETVKDVSTHFFFDHIARGTYVFEYPVFVTHAGNFSNGITSIQCMYAPEFTAHSEGVRLLVR